MQGRAGQGGLSLVELVWVPALHPTGWASAFPHGHGQALPTQVLSSDWSCNTVDPPQPLFRGRLSLQAEGWWALLRSA